MTQPFPSWPFNSLLSIQHACDLLGKLIVTVDSHPELLAPLREEVVSVLGNEGWEKTSLYKLKKLRGYIPLPTVSNNPTEAKE